MSLSPCTVALTLGSPQGMTIVFDASQEVSEVSGEDKTWTWVGSTDPPPPHFGLAMDTFFWSPNRQKRNIIKYK